MKRLLASLLVATLIAGAAAPVLAQSASGPKTVIHFVTVSWKKDATPEQIKAALDGAHKLPDAYKGITQVWTKTLKAQGEHKQVIAMEFTSEQALQEYTDSAAQKEWYKVYLPIRDHSTTFDVTND